MQLVYGYVALSPYAACLCSMHYDLPDYQWVDSLQLRMG